MTAGARPVSGPTLSVVIPTRDRSQLLRQALSSVRPIAEDGVDIEIIVVDASVEQEAAVTAVAAEFGARLIAASGAWAAAARNLGMAAATGEYLLFLDDDDVLLPTHVHMHLELLRSRPELGAVFGQVQLADFSLQDVGPPFPDPGPVADAFTQLLQRMQQIGSFVVHASVLETVGPFDESLQSSEDWDWELRLALRHDVAFVPVPCMLFRQRPTGTDDQLNLRRLACMRRVFWRNVRRASGRRPSAPALLRNLIRHNGGFAGHFLSSWRHHAAAGDWRPARHALRGAILASPPHVLAWMCRDPRLVAGVLRSLSGRRSTAGLASSPSSRR